MAFSRGNLLEIVNLRFGYSEAAAMSCPDFSVSQGDFVCITGANGTGKTTLLKTIAGLLPPLGGTIGRPERGALIGYLPQQGPMQKDFPASVMEVVRSGCQALRGFRPFYSFAERRRAVRIMERLGISDLSRLCYRELSGGQRQRVLLARALVAPHPLQLLDEPASALDAEATAQLKSLLAELAAKGVAVIMVTHDNPADWGATRVVNLSKVNRQ